MTPSPDRREMVSTSPPSIAYARGRASRRGWARNLITLACMGIVGGAYIYLGKSRQVPAPVATAPIVTTPRVAATAPPAQARGESPEKVYRESIAPLLAEFDQRNHLAVEHALSRLHDSMLQHRAGVKPFATDLTKIGTRFGVLRRYSSDLWSHLVSSGPPADGVKQYVNAKFRARVLSEPQLQSDVSGVLSQFEEEMSANRNHLYAELSLPLSRVKVASPALDDGFAAFRKTVDERAAQMSGTLGRDTMVGGLAELAGAWVATDVAQSIATRVVGQVIGQLGASMAVEGVEAGGATLGGAATGGGTGSLVGPAGTVVGIGVGIAVGIVVDYWISERFEQRIVQQCNGFLAIVERNIVAGPDKKPGLRQALNDTVSIVGISQRQAIWKTLTGSDSAPKADSDFVAVNR